MSAMSDLYTALEEEYRQGGQAQVEKWVTTLHPEWPWKYCVACEDEEPDAFGVCAVCLTEWDKLSNGRYSIDPLEQEDPIQQFARDLFGSDTTVGIVREGFGIVAYCHERMAKQLIAAMEGRQE